MNIIEEATKRLGELAEAGVKPANQSPKAADTRPTEPIPQQVYRAAEAAVSSESPPRAIRHLRGGQPPVIQATQSDKVRSIDFDRLRASGFITPLDPDSQLLHEFRIIKRPLLRNAFGKGASPIKRNGNLVMVTSSLPGEGKTFVAVNLAMSIAMEVDSTVLLVDADVVMPAIPRLFGIEASRGLMDVLTERDVTIGDVMLRTNVERLALVPAGTQHRRASELLASEAMAELLDEVANRYPDRVVIFDSPPLLATTEARALASHMGQVVVVVEAERTTHGMVENALATVESCPVVLTMLNKSSASDVGSYYGYHGYGER